METRLCNIFKNTSIITLAKTILESPYKIQQGSWEGAIFKRPVKFLKTIQFWAIFNVHIFITFALHFLESTLKCLKTGQDDICVTAQQEITACWKLKKKKTLLGTFFLKAKEVKKLILKLLKNISKVFLLLENSIKTG